MTQVMGIVNQLNMYGENIYDQRVIGRVLRLLPTKLGPIIVEAIEEVKDLSQLYVDELMVLILSYEYINNMKNDSYIVITPSNHRYLSQKEKEEVDVIKRSWKGTLRTRKWEG